MRSAIRGKALGSRSHSGTRFKVAGRAESQASTAWVYQVVKGELLIMQLRYHY